MNKKSDTAEKQPITQHCLEQLCNMLMTAIPDVEISVVGSFTIWL